MSNHNAVESTLTESFVEIFKNIPIDREDVFMDCGSGLGYVLYRASTMFNEIYGVEFHPEAYKIAKTNLDVLEVKNYIMINSNILDLKKEILDRINVFYMFNPFNGKIFETFIYNVVKSIKRKNRKVLVIYLNPKCEYVFKKYLDILPLYEVRLVRKPVNYYFHQGDNL